MLLINPFELLAVLLALVFAYPWAVIALRPGPRDGLLVALTTLALSVGGLTLWLLLLALVGALRPAAALGGIILAGLAGAAWARQRGHPLWPFGRPRRRAVGRDPLALAALGVILGIAALIALNALYWPFSDDDAVSIYATHSLGIYQTRELPVGIGLYEAYPMLLPLSYVYSYLMAGGVQEYLARAFVAALGVGTLGASVALGAALYGRAAGLAAGTLLALTPSFTRWASSGYSDVPAALFVGLAALFAWRLREEGRARDAALAGAMTGLAAWTKNSALAVGVSLLLWLAYLRGRGPQRIRLRAAAWALAGLGVTAGPWYARNLLAFGTLIPDTAWTDRAQRTLANLIPFAAHSAPFFLPGLVFTLGIGWALVEALRGRGAVRDASALLLIFVLPLGAAWWWAASYETRFLLVIIVPVAVMGARALLTAAGALLRARPAPRAAWRWAAALLLIALALPAARKALLFKDELLRDPFMGDARRHQLALGPVYDAAQAMRALPVHGRILSDNYFLPWQINQAGAVEAVVGGLPARERLAQYDYLVVSPGRDLPAPVQPDDVRLVIEVEGFRVYEVQKAVGD